MVSQTWEALVAQETNKCSGRCKMAAHSLAQLLHPSSKWSWMSFIHVLNLLSWKSYIKKDAMNVWSKHQDEYLSFLEEALKKSADESVNAYDFWLNFTAQCLQEVKVCQIPHKSQP